VRIFSPLEAAAQAIDLHNTASRWNKALLDNSARPSGAIVYTARDGNPTSEQIERSCRRRATNLVPHRRRAGGAPVKRETHAGRLLAKARSRQPLCFVVVATSR